MKSQRLDQLFREQASRLLRFIRHRIDDADEADDILQELFLKAAENLSALKPIDNLVAWIWTAARNRVIDYYRARARRRARIVESAGHDQKGGFADEHILDTAFGIENAFLRQEVIELLYESLAELPDEQREVFLLQSVNGYTFAEIAELTGESINTLMARKRYAVRSLNHRMAEIRDYIKDL